MNVRVLAFFVALSAAPWTSAEAQGGDSFLRPHAMEIAVGTVWGGGVDFGSINATLNANQTPGAPYTLFKTSSTLASAAGFEGRLGYRLTRMFGVEGAFAYKRPTLETAVSGDVEGVPATTARERLSQYLIDVSAIAHVRGLRLGRAVPFVFGGAGYLRELHEHDVLAESGHTFHAGGGLKLPVVERRGFIRAIGVRVDARARFRSGGADLDRSKPSRTTGELGASVIVGL